MLAPYLLGLNSYNYKSRFYGMCKQAPFLLSLNSEYILIEDQFLWDVDASATSPEFEFRVFPYSRPVFMWWVH